MCYFSFRKSPEYNFPQTSGPARRAVNFAKNGMYSCANLFPCQSLSESVVRLKFLTNTVYNVSARYMCVRQYLRVPFESPGERATDLSRLHTDRTSLICKTKRCSWQGSTVYVSPLAPFADLLFKTYPIANRLKITYAVDIILLNKLWGNSLTL